MGVDTLSPTDQYWTEKLVDRLRAKLAEDYPPGRTLRDAHTKAHGCVQAEFSVEHGLPDHLRVGLFKEPTTYPAWVRFSSSAGAVRSDTKRDVLGMGIKVLGPSGQTGLTPDGQTQDFVLVSSPTFLTPTIEKFYGFIDAYFRGWFPLALFFLDPRHARILLNLAKAAKRYSNPLATQFWSMTPYQWGDGAVKYRAKPETADLPTAATGPDYLRDAMKATLADRDVGFDFMIQRRTDPGRMPIDDASVDWPEALSPFVKVATVKILRGDFDTPERWSFGENLSFDPWHCLPEHVPIGSINLARRHAYRVLSEFRHRRNDVAPRPPFW